MSERELLKWASITERNYFLLNDNSRFGKDKDKMKSSFNCILLQQKALKTARTKILNLHLPNTCVFVYFQAFAE